MHKVIIDTDIGTNPDDAIALSLAAKSPEIQIEGITTVYGNVDIRAKIAKQILDLCNMGYVDVYTGIEQPLLRNRKVFWSGIEGKDLKLKEDYRLPKKHAVDFIIETIMENPGEITLVTIGPLTNIATAIILEPKIITNVKQLVTMAGVTRLGKNGMYLSHVEHNVKSDPEAASVVFSSGANIMMVGLDVTRQVVLFRDEKDKMAACGTPLASTLSSMIDTHMDYMDRNFSYMSDPVAVSVLIDRSIVYTKQMEVQVDYTAHSESGQTIAHLCKDGNVEVCFGVDQNRFFQLLKDRVFT